MQVQKRVLAHPALFAGLSAAGEIAGVLLLLVPLTARLGGTVSAVVGAVGLALAWPMAFRWIGLLPALPWTAAGLALLAHGLRLPHLGLPGAPHQPPAEPATAAVRTIPTWKAVSLSCWR